MKFSNIYTTSFSGLFFKRKGKTLGTRLIFTDTCQLFGETNFVDLCSMFDNKKYLKKSKEW